MIHYPEAHLKNKDLHLTVVLPDEKTGFYRSCRFDWSGMVSGVQYLGHTFMEQPFARHHPEEPSCGIGTAEEFRACTPEVRDSLGYPEANPGEGFIKIGVGILIKETCEAYHFAKKYDFIKAGKWEIDITESSAVFRQSLRLDKNHGYEYTKSIIVDPVKSAFNIFHAIKNTGEKPLHINHYCHNFFMIDNEPIGHHYQALFPFIPHLETEKCPHKEYFDLQGQAVGFCCELAENEMTGTGVKGHNSNILHNSFRIQNRRTGAGVKVSSDKPAVSIYMCAGRRFFSVEPQIEILARTGEEFKWANTYEFYT